MNTTTSPFPGKFAIEVENLECRYGERPVLEHVSFAVKRGEIFFIIGGSGCGKSTLLRNMVGLHPPAKGAVRYFGQDFTHAAPAQRKALLRTFGVLYQSGALWSSMTLRENVSLPLELYADLTRREREAIVALKLAQVGLAGYEDYYPAEISGGMKKRAGLARALALDPAVVFFDEPSAGLDPLSARRLDELILELRASMRCTVVVVTHELASIFTIADSAVFLDADTRTMLDTGAPKDLMERSKSDKVRLFLRRGEPAPKAA